jgi:hypothetical protein
MPGKRQHYVPRFLVRRFCIDPADRRSRLWRLDKKSGRPQQVNPANEMVVGHYYRIVLDDGKVIDEADTVLDRVENMAADVVPKVAARDYTTSGDDVYRLMLFLATLQNRTPQMREALREMDERGAELDLETFLSNRDRYHQVAAQEGEGEDEVEARRLQLLTDLNEGRLGVRSTPEREVALMFMGLEEVTNTLVSSMDITCMRIADDSRRSFVLSDHPVSHYDPTPTTPESGAGFMSSPGSLTWVPLDPKFGLLLGQEHPGYWMEEEPDDEGIDELNLLTYAWARDAIYGPTQDSVTRVRHAARKNPALMKEVRYRPARLWVARGGGEDGPHEFESRFGGHKVKRTVYTRKAEGR